MSIALRVRGESHKGLRIEGACATISCQFTNTVACEYTRARQSGGQDGPGRQLDDTDQRLSNYITEKSVVISGQHAWATGASSKVLASEQAFGPRALL